VFEEVGKSPDVATDYGFSKKMLLCFSPDNHYDSVYPKLYIVKAAFCQCKYFCVTNKQLRNKLNILHISILSFPGTKPELNYYNFLPACHISDFSSWVYTLK